MTRLPLITICSAFLLFAHNFVGCLSNGLEGPELNKLVEKYQNSEFPFQARADIATPKYRLTYTRGTRIPGDRLIASTSESRQWPVAQNVTLNLSYPRAGVGSNISKIEVYVTQDTTLGSGVLTAGDIHQRHISVTIGAYKTLTFGHTTYIYGY